ncbi:hypothetical protein J1N35_019020 [Gossypium stocksii]|uniref:DDE Tnp4 domain-containing protein n=1 Tax=Gossypium stocksii TaxID=47602 RepID=A0A9D4A775_9ROSI|nr:hypothetical protein J1N35_019020 [Gossypium stocksii]
MTNFEKEINKAYSQRQLINRWDALKKEWKAWKKLKDGDTSLGRNPIKRTVDAKLVLSIVVYDCIGAIDGTHIAAILPPNEKIPYIGRKVVPSQDVMAVCDFNMCFTFVMARWEGSVHDTRIFLDAIRDQKYKFLNPPNGYLGPYRG